MTARERKTSGDPSATATARVAVAPATAGAGRNGVEPDTIPIVAWQEWYRHASASQQAEMLALAARQGLLYAHQPPPPAGGLKARPVIEDTSHLQVLIRLLSGNTDDLLPVQPQPLALVDDELDPVQREAVARALSTPDIFLLQGLPGTGKSRVLAEVLTQAARQGLRVLFVSDRPAGVDVVLERLAGREAVSAVRYLGADEKPAALAPAILALTPEYRTRACKEDTVHKAAQACEKAEERCRRRQSEAGLWYSLRELAKKLPGMHERLREVRRSLAEVELEVQREADTPDVQSPGPFQAEISLLQRSHAEASEQAKAVQRQHQEQRSLLEVDLEKSRLEFERLRPLAQARLHGRWWTLTWWRAIFQGDVQGKWSEAQARFQSIEQARHELDKHANEQCERSFSRQEQFELERARLIQAEAARRRRQWTEEESVLLGEQRQLDQEWRAFLDPVEPDLRPAVGTLDAIAVAHGLWESRTQLDEQALDFARRWVEYVARNVDALAGRVSEWANVLAGTTAALAGSEFSRAAAGLFDLLILEDADGLTEVDLLRLARHARRWILVGEGTGAAAGAEPRSEGFVAVPGCFRKLWQTLHCDSPRLHYRWTCIDDSGKQPAQARLRCTLRHVGPEERRYLEVERLVDFPEIELGILSAPHVPPVLAEVTFPADMPLAKAKDFIHRELQEAAVQAMCRGGWLSEEADHYRFHLSPYPFAPHELAPLELEHGVREWLAAGNLTQCVEFCKQAGWTRPRVDQWLQRQLHLRDWGRSANLQVAYRLGADLAVCMGTVLFHQEYLAPQNAHSSTLEFVAVPPLRREERNGDRRHTVTHNGTQSLPREGAGLEQDLSSPRAAERLPADLRAGLPRHGFANHLEAQAVVRKLEELTREDADRSIAVVALYDGQVELLRRLTSRSEVLRHRPIEIGLPGSFAQREFDLVLVSLTRSHQHRAVTFGERESDLPLGLTRARKRLLVFGDPGTLAKRQKWEGPLEHLDAAAALQEARRVGWLLRCMQSPVATVGARF